jgi:pimeloyl-ACP methyl ester carboxylesterase
MKHLADFTDPKVAARYAHVPDTEMEKFRVYCDTYPYRQITINGVEWSYLYSNDSGEALLLLSGALIIPDISWNSISHFGKNHRTIVPVYPAVNTMDALVDGIAEILRREGIQQAHVMGGSYGGFVAQVFVRRHPEMTRSLVLSHTLPPNPTGIERIRKTMRLMALLPLGLLRWVLGRQLSKLMPADTSSGPGALLMAMFQETLNYRLNKADILGIFWRTLDYYARTFTHQDLANWPGKVLLVLADDDPGTPEPVRAALQALYPSARMHLLHGGGHVTSVVNQEEYQAVIDEFLSKV